MTDGVSDEIFARHVVQAKLATFEQIRAARHAQALAQQSGHTLQLPDILVADGIISKEQRDQALKTLIGQGSIAKLGKYKILKELGRGGMGKVFLAEDTLAGRQVALKVLSKKLAENRDFISRFRREAKATGKLNHQNIVAAFDAGEDQGRHYYAMEYCAGKPLSQLLKSVKFLPWQRAVSIVTQVAEGLKHAHENGVLHRDIKPDNIFLTTNDTAKILDLGLSKDVEDPGSSFHTQSGNAVGTPHYMSPEQAKGEKIDGRADIYGLGATFYHLLAGEPPFDGPTAATVMLKHLTDDVPNPQDVQADIPDGVVALLWKMMARNPAERYSDCDALLTDLHRVMSGQDPISVGSSDSMEQVERVEQVARVVAEKPARASGAGIGIAASRTKTPPAQHSVRRLVAERMNAQAKSSLIGILSVAALVLVGCALVASMFSQDKLTNTKVALTTTFSSTQTGVGASKDPGSVALPSLPSPSNPVLPPQPPPSVNHSTQGGDGTSDFATESVQLERRAQIEFDGLEKKLATLATVEQKVAAIDIFEKEFSETMAGSRARILKGKLTAPPAPPTPPNPMDSTPPVRIIATSKEQGESLSALLNHGRTCAEAHDYAGAIADLDKAVQLDSNQHAIFHNRAAMKFQLGDNFGALADVDQAIALGSKTWQSWGLRAMICFGLSRDDEYHKAVETAAQMSQSTVAQMEQRLQHDAQRARAIQMGKPLEGKALDSVNDLLARAHSRLELGRVAECAEDLKEVLKRDPSIGVKGAYQQLADIARQLKNYREMMSYLKQWADSKPESAQAMNYYAWELLTCADNSLRDPKVALQYSEKSAELTKHADPIILDTLALAYFSNGRAAVALSTEEKAITLLPANAAPQSRKEYEDRVRQFRDALPR